MVETNAVRVPGIHDDQRPPASIPAQPNVPPVLPQEQLD